MSHDGVLINWSKCGQKLDNNGQEVHHWSAIVLTVFETFLNGQTVFRYGSKRVRNTLEQLSKSGQPGVTRGSARGHQRSPGVSQGSASVHQGVSQGHQGVSQGSGNSQPRVSQESLVYFHTTQKYSKFLLASAFMVI